jgi:hypothetical protein
MCYFITLAVPQKYAASVSDGVPRGLSVWPLSNPSLQASLPAEYEQFMITSGIESAGSADYGNFRRAKDLP